MAVARANCEANPTIVMRFDRKLPDGAAALSAVDAQYAGPDNTAICPPTELKEAGRRQQGNVLISDVLNLASSTRS